jgi:hypothetical protein
VPSAIEGGGKIQDRYGLTKFIVRFASGRKSVGLPKR